MLRLFVKSAQSPVSVLGPHLHGGIVPPTKLYIPFGTAPWTQAIPSLFWPNPMAAQDEAIHPDSAADQRAASSWLSNSIASRPGSRWVRLIFRTPLWLFPVMGFVCFADSLRECLVTTPSDSGCAASSLRMQTHLRSWLHAPFKRFFST